MDEDILFEIFGENLAKKKLKSVKLDPLDDSVDSTTKKLYEYLTYLTKDKKYSGSSKKPELYIRIFNQFHEWPDFMQKWIQDEYVYLRALKITNADLSIHKNSYSKQLVRIINDLAPCDTKCEIDSLLDKLVSDDIYVDEKFFENIRYAMRQSPLTSNEVARFSLLLEDWFDMYKNILVEKKRKISAQI